MLFYAQNGFALANGAWWWFVPPGLLIALLGMGLSLVNFSIDEVINPRLGNVRAQRRRDRRAKRAARSGGSPRVAPAAHDTKGVAR
jgi:peptide/nickel transport system permease protein